MGESTIEPEVIGHHEAAVFPEKRSYTEEQINDIRTAIEKEKETKAAHDAHEKALAETRTEYERTVAYVKVMSKRADDLKNKLGLMESVQFDYSDDFTIAAAEDMLHDMERVYGNQKADAQG